MVRSFVFWPRREESSDGFAAELAKRGVKCMEFDILNDPQEQNLLDEDVFWKLLNQVRARKFEGLLMKPPSVTFSAYVADGDPLRRPWGKGLYGCSGLGSVEKTKVREGTLMAYGALKIFESAVELDIPAVHVHPLEREDHFNWECLFETQKIAQGSVDTP